MDHKTDRITVRLSKAEARSLGQMTERLGVSESQTVRMCVASARPVVVSTGDEAAVRECSRTIGRMGGLLNQVAHRLNERRDHIPGKDELAGILALIERLSGDLASARSELASLRERQGVRIEEALGQVGRTAVVGGDTRRDVGRPDGDCNADDTDCAGERAATERERAQGGSAAVPAEVSVARAWAERHRDPHGCGTPLDRAEQ